MLYLVTRTVGQQIRVGNTAIVTITEVQDGKVGLLFDPLAEAQLAKRAGPGKPQRSLLRRTVGEAVRIGQQVQVMILAIHDGLVRLAVETGRAGCRWQGDLLQIGAAGPAAQPAAPVTAGPAAEYAGPGSAC